MVRRCAGSRFGRLSIIAAIASAVGALGALGATAGATEPDTTPPVVALSGSAVKAVEEGKATGSYELHIAATDGSLSEPQSGIAKIEVGVNGSGQQSWEKYCPEGSCGLEETWSYVPGSYSSEFPRWITVKVTDHAGNTTEEEISVEGLEEVPREAAPTGTDNTAPTIALSGSAVKAVEESATSGTYELRMKATDGSPTAPQSGVAKIEVAVEGTTLQSWEKYCPVGSCRLKVQWTYVPASYSGTGHVITVTVHDKAGNVTTQTLTPVEPIGVTDGQLTACPAEGGGKRELGHPEEEAAPGGGSILIYTLDDGVRIEIPRPPAGFNVATATNAELERYGIPARPSGGAALTEWKEEYEGVNFSYTEPPCALSAGTESLLPPAPASGLHANSVSELFAGYTAGNEKEPGIYNGVKGQFTIPSAGSTPCKVSGESSWVALGGRSENNSAAGFIQAGTLMRVGGKNELLFQVWNSPYHYHNIAVPPMKISEKDPLHVKVTYNPKTEVAVATFIDGSEGRVVPAKELGSAYYNGRYVSAADERPFNWASGNLRNFGSTTWSQVQARESSGGEWRPIGELPWHKLVMEEHLKPPALVETSALGGSGEGFVDKWLACHG